MATGSVPTAPEDYYGDRYREMNAQLAKRERSAKRKSRESLAARGALHSGMTNTTERDIEGSVNELWHEGARDIENMRWQADQKDIDRGHQLTMQSNQFGENAAQRGWQTGEREGTQLFQSAESAAQRGWQSGENTAQRQMEVKIQEMADSARYQLQELVNSGQMSLQEAEQEWTSFENDLNRTLEKEMQGATIAQEQWAAEFGFKTAMDIQNDTQSFEQFMSEQGREWELADRPWQEQMWMLDAQLQMAVSGHDWWDDAIAGGPPEWMGGDVYDAEGNLNTGYMLSFGSEDNVAGGGLDESGSPIPMGTVIPGLGIADGEGGYWEFDDAYHVDIYGNEYDDDNDYPYDDPDFGKP